LTVDVAGWSAQLDQVKEHFAKFGDRLPAQLQSELEALEQRLSA